MPLITIAFYISLTWLGGTLLIAKRFQALFYILIIILSTLGLSGWNTQHLSNRLIPEQAQLASLLLSLGRQLSDSDGDGALDSLEIEKGSDPKDASDTPFQALPAVWDLHFRFSKFVAQKRQCVLGRIIVKGCDFV